MQSNDVNLIWREGQLLSPGPAIPGDRTLYGMRIWDPKRSKVAALCYVQGDLPIKQAKILYLGAASGTTVSFLSDYAEVIYAVEFSARPMQTLVRLCEHRKNIIPIYQDARSPEYYGFLVEPVDLLIQDIAQRDQAEILVQNLSLLQEGGQVVLFLKTLSMGIAAKKSEFINDSLEILQRAGVHMLHVQDIEAYHVGHVAISGKYDPHGLNDSDSGAK